MAFNPLTTSYDPQNALLLCQASALAYQDGASIAAAAQGLGFPKTRFFSRGSTQAFLMANDQSLVAAFRGTEPTVMRDWESDSDTRFVDGTFGKVHGGFQRGLQAVWEDVRNAIGSFQDNRQSLWLTGHSLGAALATLAAAELLNEAKPFYGLYTFGSPRVVGADFQRVFDQYAKDFTFRFVNGNDPVPRVPSRLAGFSHVGTFLYFDNDGALKRDPGFWFRLLDGARGAIDEPELVKYHAIANYQVQVAKLQPFPR
ncbi:MAG TPA: lipase family protein [Holophagaceae bacterium]|nr:lipase family protein [Holophagaceae bacterium]